MPIGQEDPNNNPNYQEHKNQNQNSVDQREGIAARGAERAGDEPVDVEEEGDEDEERKRNVDDVFGVTLESQEEE